MTADAHSPGAGEAQAPPSAAAVPAEMRRGGQQPGTSPGKPSALKDAQPFRAGRRTAAAAAVVLLGGALVVSRLAAGSGSAAGRVVDGSTVEYTAGHRPLVPDITAASLTGTTVKISAYRGRVLVLNFWGSWCAPCRAEAPALEAAYQHYRVQGVDFLGDDVGDTPSNALSFIRGESIGYPSINDPGYSFVQQFSRAAPVSDPPATAVIDKTGHVAGMVLGPVSNGELTALLREAASARP